MSSPTQRTLAELRSRNLTAEVVERWQSSFAERNVVREATEAAQTGMLAGVRRAVAEAKRFGPGRRIDLFGFIDIVAVGGGSVLAVQCTATGSMQNRRLKIVTECCDAARAWLSDGGQIEVWGWKKYAKAIDRKFWRPTIVPIWLEEVAVPERPS